MKKEKTRQSIELAGLEYFRGTYPTWNMVGRGELNCCRKATKINGQRGVPRKSYPKSYPVCLWLLMDGNGKLYLSAAAQPRLVARPDLTQLLALIADHNAERSTVCTADHFPGPKTNGHAVNHLPTRVRTIKHFYLIGHDASLPKRGVESSSCPIRLRDLICKTSFCQKLWVTGGML